MNTLPLVDGDRRRRPPTVYRARDQNRERMMASEGIDPVQIYETATERYQRGITRQGCCWYMFVDVACFDRTDHVDEPLTPPATDPEPIHDSPPPLVEDSDTVVEDSDSDSAASSPFDWLFELGDGYAAKCREVH